MLYTVVSPAEIFMQPPAQATEYEIDGSFISCRKTENGEVVERLISTDPFEYLKPCYSPGTPYAAGKDKQ